MTGEVQFNVVPGMTVENVQRNGSEAQAKAIVLFDINNDGVIYRADNLNSLEIYRSDLEKLNAKNVDTIDIKATANRDLWDTSSELILNKNTNLKVDENSKVAIKYNQEQK